MKIVFFSILIIALCQSSFAASSNSKKKKLTKKSEPVTADKVYTVEETTPQILIGPKDAEDLKLQMGKRPKSLWYAALVRSGLHYSIPSFKAGTLSFSPQAFGVILGKKVENQFYLYKGFYELNIEWQTFKRESTSSNGLYSQKLNLYQINLFQSFDLARVSKKSILFSMGIGIAPVYLTTEQSVFANSTSELGYMGMLKGNMSVPFNIHVGKNLEADVGLRLGWGKVGSHEIATTSLSLGLNFE